MAGFQVSTEVAALCNAEADGGRTAVCYADISACLDGASLPKPPFFADRTAALAVLHIGDDTQVQPILIASDAR
jgi:hypothetical protein